MKEIKRKEQKMNGKGKQKEFKDKNLRGIIMKSIHIRTCMNIIATLIGVTGIILIKLFEEWAITTLWIEIVILPVIYIIGNDYIGEKIKEEYQTLLSNIGEGTEKIKQEYLETTFLNKELLIKLKQMEEKHGL